MKTPSDRAALAGLPANRVEHALHGAVRDRRRIGELFDELRQGRLWLPLPDDGTPVTDGHALTLPTVRYLGAEFVPAFTSAGQLSETRGRGLGFGPEDANAGCATAAAGAEVPHAVVPAAELARLLPAGLGIALNPGAPVSVPIYPEDIAYLAGTHADVGGSLIHVGHPPEEPARLLSAVAAGLRRVGSAASATRAWLITESGQGLVICVTLDDPHDSAAQQSAADAVQDAVDLTWPRFPVDVTFHGECQPGPLERWAAANGKAFYVRG